MREKVLSIIAAALMPLPLLIAAFVSEYAFPAPFPLIVGIMGGALSWAAGYGLGALIYKLRSGKKAGLAMLGFYFVGFLIVVAAFALLASASINSMACLFIPAAFIYWYWFGYRQGSKQELASYASLGIYCVEAALMFPLCGSFEGSNHTGSYMILGITALLTVIMTVVINLRQLAKLSLRGQNTGAVLSKATVRFNTLRSLFFAGIILITFFFAGFGAKWLWELAKAIIRFLLSLFVGVEPIKTEYDTDLGEPDFYVQEKENILIQIIAFIIIITAIILFMKPMIKAIKEAIDSLLKKLGRGRETVEAADYVDIYESNEKSNNNRNLFKKLLKEYKREKDPDKKFRLGYMAFMVRIGERTEKNNPSDTVRIHLGKGRRITDYENLEKVVNTYCGLRYDGRSPDRQEQEMMKDLLKAIL